MLWKKIFKKKDRELPEEGWFKRAHSDRRRDQRIEAENEVILEIVNSKTLDEQEKIQVLAKSLDISVGGIRVESPVEFTPESLIRLRIPSDQLGNWIQVLGRIKWIKKIESEKVIEFGLEFIDTPPETVIDLMDYIYRRRR